MGKTKKVNLWLVLMMTLIAALSCFFGVFTLKDGKNNISASADTVAMDDKITISTWGEAETGITWIHVALSDFTVAGGDWHSADSNKIAANNNVDPLEYTYINGKSAREHYTANSSSLTVITATGWVEAYIIKVSTSYLALGNFTVQLKAGFTLVGADSNVYSLSNDTSIYGWDSGAFGVVANAISETAAMDGNIAISTWGEAETGITWMHVALSNFTVAGGDWHSATCNKIAANNNVDPLEYVYINGTSAREHYTANSSSLTVITATGWTEAFIVKVSKTYLDLGNFTIQLKAGFTLVGADGKAYVLQNDTATYGWTDGVFGEVEETEPEVETVSMDDKIAISTWGLQENNTCVWMHGALSDFTVAGGDWHNADASKIAANNGVDPLEYVYINGTSAREHYTANSSSLTVITATGWTEAFVVKVNPSYLALGEFTIQLKAGFTLVGADGLVYELQNDTAVYGWTDGVFGVVEIYTLSFSSEAGTVDPITVTNGSAIGELPAVPEKSGYTGVWQIDGVTITADTVYNYGANKTATAVYTQNLVETNVTETVSIVNSSYAEAQSQFIIQLSPASTLTSNAWWNINGDSLITANNGVDIMNYIYINEKNLRTLSDDNRTNNTYPLGSGTGWLGNSDQCRPAFVESTSGGIYVTVLHAFSTTNYTITLKAGFKLLLSDGSIATLSEDVNFVYNAGTITKIQEYTLSFEGLDDTVQVFTNQAIGELPALPEVEGESVLGWAIDGALISEDTLWTYSENKTAQPLYAQKYTLSFDGLEDTLTVVENEMIGELPEVPAKDGCEGVWAIEGEEINQYTVYTYGANKTAVAAYKKDITKTFTLGDYSDDGDLCFVATDFNTDSTVSGTWHTTNLVSANGGVDIMEYVYVKGSSARALSNENASSNTYVGTESWLANGYACCPVFIETTTSSGLWIRIVDDFAGNFFEITFKAGFRLIDTEGTVVYLSENVTYKYINDNGTVTFTKGTITAEDLDKLNGQNITLMNGAEVYAEKKTGGWTLPAINPISDGNNDNETLDQVFVGWTTAETFVAGTSDLYPAGHLFVPTGTTTLYAVWIGFELEDGAGVRLTSGSSGYRFKARIDSTHYKTTYKAIILDIGTIVTPTNYLDYVDFTHTALGSSNYSEVSKATLGEAWQWMQGGEGSTDATWIYAAAFTGIPENMYSRMNSARGYLKINYTSGAGYIYTPYNEENNARSIYSVATAAYDDYNGHTTLKEYVNKVADITWTLDSFAQTADTKGSWTITDISADGANITVAVEGDFASVLINGKRLVEGYSANVALGNYIYKFSDLAFTDGGFTFVLGAADDVAGKVSDETLYFDSSDEDLDFFLNDFFKRHSGYTENGENLKVNSTIAGVNSEEFFSHEWMSMAYYWYNIDDGYAEDRLAGLRKFLSSVPVDDYGYVWSSNDNVRPNDATPSSAEQRMGWPYPSNDDIKGISWDFNGSTDSWSNNISATSSNNLYTASVSGQTADIVFTSPSASVSGFKVNWYTYRKIYTYSAPLLEFDIRIDDVTNVNDILVGYTTSAQSTTQWVSVKENAFMSYDIGNATGAYNHLIFMPMYAFWGESTSTYLKQIQIKIDIKDGKSMSGNVGLNYVRPTIDTRYSNNNSILISSLRQDYEFTGDLAYLQDNITRARKAMNFLMQMYDSTRKLNKQSYLVGHDGDQSDIETSLGNGYWDILFMPEYDFQSNMYFYKALVDMAYLEGVLTENTVDTSLATVKTATRSGEASTSAYSYTADSLNAIANDVLGAMQATTANGGFWNESTDRFAAGYSSSGTLYDYGYVAWNLEAIYYGIATEDQATDIMTWLNSETDLYGYTFAPLSITETGNKTVLNGQYYNNSSIKNSWVNCQYGGAIMYTSFYDLMARINYGGANDAYARLQEIQAWYMEVYNYYVGVADADPNDFYRYYYENKGIQMQGQGTNGEILIDAEALESYLPLSAVAYGFFGIDSIDNGKTLQIAPKLPTEPTELNYWGMENLAFHGVEYDLKAYKNGVQITSVRGETTGLSMQVALDYASGQSVYVNGVKWDSDDYTVENGKVCVTVDFGAAIVEVK